MTLTFASTAIMGLFIYSLSWKKLNRYAAYAVSMSVYMWILLCVLYFAADYFTGYGIDKSVLYHLRVGFDGAGLMEYSWLIIGSFSVLLGGLWGSVRLTRWLVSETVQSRTWYHTVFSLLLLVGAFITHPAIQDLGRFAIRQMTSKSPTPSEHYVALNQINLPVKKNLVLLYLESVERTYLDETLFPELMPNLKRLEAQATSFTNIHQLDGTQWTIAGMTASQCGIPLVIEGNKNSMSGLDHFLPRAQCLGDLLKPAGYNLLYRGGSRLSFAGKGNFYRTHGFESIKGFDELEMELSTDTPSTSWGWYDDTLLPYVAQEFDLLRNNQQPFGIFTLTLDTHHPRGHITPTCSDVRYGDGSNRMLNALHCADRLAGEFIEHVINAPQNKDTVLVVASDHLAMNNDVSDQLNQGERRNLLLVFDPQAPPEQIDRQGSLLDVPATILGFLGAKDQAMGYGRDLRGATPTLFEQYSDDEVEDILSSDMTFLSGLWDFPQLYAGLTVNMAKQLLRLEERTLTFPTLLTLDDSGKVNSTQFPNGGQGLLLNNIKKLEREQDFLWVDDCKNIYELEPKAPREHSYCIALGRLDAEELWVQPLEDKLFVSFSDVQERLRNQPSSQAIFEFRSNKIEELEHYGTSHVEYYKGDPALIGSTVVQSSGYDPLDYKTSFVWSESTQEKVNLKRGLTLLGFATDDTPVKLGYTDTCDMPPLMQDTAPLIVNLKTLIEKHKGQYNLFAVVAHDSARCGTFDFEGFFANTGLTRGEEIGFRQPYVGLIAVDGKVQEYLGPQGASFAVELTNSSGWIARLDTILWRPLLKEIIKFSSHWPSPL